MKKILIFLSAIIISVRAYGTNSAGTAYGSEMTFRTITLQQSGKIIMHNGKIVTID